jgi:lactoylglutathione lyase
MATSLVHTCVRVRDVDASIRFYRALGFEERGRLNFASAYNVYLGLPGDGDRLELTVNVGREEPYDLGEGYNHVAVTVEDIDGVLARLAEIGVEPGSRPITRATATTCRGSRSWPTRTATASSSSTAAPSPRRRTARTRRRPDSLPSWRRPT